MPEQVVHILNSGHTKEPFLGACARTSWLLQVKFNISVKVVHIKGTSNTYADTLSRWPHFKHGNSPAVNHLISCCWLRIQDKWLEPDFLYNCRWHPGSAADGRLP